MGRRGGGEGAKGGGASKCIAISGVHQLAKKKKKKMRGRGGVWVPLQSRKTERHSRTRSGQEGRDSLCGRPCGPPEQWAAALDGATRPTAGRGRPPDPPQKKSVALANQRAPTVRTVRQRLRRRRHRA